jgi:peptidoglycan/xylan/chitin deacetylase (PgdA/CDA1 family)
MGVRRMLGSLRDAARGQGRALARRFSHPLLVLCYHRVGTLSSDPQALAVRPTNFLAQMRHLAARYTVLRSEGNWGPSIPGRVMVTFDDGYADNYLEALPLLRKAAVPATFFIATGLLGRRQEFFWDELERLLLLPGKRPRQLRLSVGVWPMDNPAARARAYGDLLPRLKALGPGPREALMDEIRIQTRRGSAGRPSHRCLTSGELQRLAKDPLVTIGAHSITHACLAALGPAEVQEEVAGSARDLETTLGKAVKVFAYPFGGRNDVSTAAARACKQAGFERAFTTGPGAVTPWSGRFELPRFLVRDWGVAEFEQRLQAAWRA